ncbi:CoA transferase [Streptomyces sp. NPDC018057]|uniref:CoA transferase n=1 Tax=unclassified Streptomyces TaxID=2593676 RepID=UPI0037B9F8E8
MPTPRDILREPARALAALPGLAEGATLALGGPPLPESLLARLLASGPRGLHLLCARTALDSPQVRRLLADGRFAGCTVAVPSPAQGGTGPAAPVPVEWLTVQEMTEGLRAGAAGVDDFYSPGEVHTAIRTPSPDQARDKPAHLRLGPLPFAHKASLRCDAALLYADEADLAGNLAVTGPYAELSAAMAHAAASGAVAECAVVRTAGRLSRAATTVPGRYVTALVPTSRHHRFPRHTGGRTPPPGAEP